MICSDHADRGKGSFGWRIFSGAKDTQQRGKETHRGGNAEGREGDVEPGRAHASPMQSSAIASSAKSKFAKEVDISEPGRLETAFEGESILSRVDTLP